MRLKIDTSSTVDFQDLRKYLQTRSTFLVGAQVELFWEPEIPEYQTYENVKKILREEFKAYVEDFEQINPQNTLELPQDIDEESFNVSEVRNVILESDLQKNATIFYGPLRSGQRIESDSTIVLVGDANQASEIISGGDIFVLGALRGLAHAGAFEDRPQNRVIFALSLFPIQLRIGSVISRGDGLQLRKNTFAEIARLDDDQIVVEPYDTKFFQKRGRIIHV
ncbi:MAG: hypothetical protein NZO16_07735 [Deltaproteobacteria bacterium]|nr:hypothetical protein [Deltaproteobacteria bacterium]